MRLEGKFDLVKKVNFFGERTGVRLEEKFDLVKFDLVKKVNFSGERTGVRLEGKFDLVEKAIGSLMFPVCLQGQY